MWSKVYFTEGKDGGPKTQIFHVNSIGHFRLPATIIISISEFSLFPKEVCKININSIKHVVLGGFLNV